MARSSAIAAFAALALAVPALAQDSQGEGSGVTPMAEREVVVSVLDKVSNETFDYEVKPGDRIQYRALSIRVVACEATPPWAAQPQQGAFLQVDQRVGEGRNRVFSGWLFAESPSLNSFDHPVYDVWVKSCTMSFPDSGEDTVRVN